MDDVIKGRPLDIMIGGMAAAVRLNAPDDVLKELRSAHIRTLLGARILKDVTEPKKKMII